MEFITEQPPEYYVLRNGTQLQSESGSDKMYRLAELRPEKHNKNDTGYEWCEMGMACLFGELYNEEARYCADYKSWFTYNNGIWQKDTGAILVSEKIKDFVRIMLLYCGEIEEDDVRKKYFTFINKMGKRTFREHLLKDAQGEMLITASEFDSDPYLINCLNGTYNLKDFSFYEPKWDDFLTLQTSFRHTVSRDVKSERWLQFIDEITEGDKNKADFLQRALGYSLLGHSNEECMFILHGKTTRNGKSTMLNTIETLLGDYATVSPVGMICKGERAKDVDAASPMLMLIKGKRFVTMAESNEYGKLDEEKIKQLTGGENITARALFKDAITFKPQFTMWLSCNDLPRVTDLSLFNSNRIKLVEFNRHFKREEQDIHLKQELTTQRNMSGIFMWLVRGYIRYKERGLTMNEKMEAVTSEYAKSNDSVLQFLEARCERTEKVNIKAKDLYSAYKSWARAEGEPMLSAYKFNCDMERHPEWFERKSQSCGFKIYWGLQLAALV